MNKRLLPFFVSGAISAGMTAHGSATPGATEVACELAVDFAKPAGRIRPLNGVNNGPFAAGKHTADMEAWLIKRGILPDGKRSP